MSQPKSLLQSKPIRGKHLIQLQQSKTNPARILYHCATNALKSPSINNARCLDARSLLAYPPFDKNLSKSCVKRNGKIFITPCHVTTTDLTVDVVTGLQQPSHHLCLAVSGCEVQRAVRTLQLLHQHRLLRNQQPNRLQTTEKRSQIQAGLALHVADHRVGLVLQDATSKYWLVMVRWKKKFSRSSGITPVSRSRYYLTDSTLFLMQ